jgi:hypothetical protein
MRTLLALAACAMLGLGAGCADIDSSLSSLVTAHFHATPYTPKAALYANGMMQNAIIGCRNKRLDGELTNFTQSAICSNALILAVYDDIKYPYMDLISLVASDRLAASEKIDSGVWTEKQAQTEMTELGATVNAEIARRELLAAAAPSQSSAASSGASPRQISASGDARN